MIPKVPEVMVPITNTTSDLSSLAIVATKDHNRATIIQNFYVWCSIILDPIEKTVLPLLSLMVKIIKSSLTALPLKMYCLFSMKREDIMPAQKTNSLEQVNGRWCFLNVSHSQIFNFYWSSYCIAELAVTVC